MTTATCSHHWKIATPDGRRELPAICTDCGATKQFRASLEDYVAAWDRPDEYKQKASRGGKEGSKKGGWNKRGDVEFAREAVTFYE